MTKAIDMCAMFSGLSPDLSLHRVFDVAHTFRVLHVGSVALFDNPF